MLLSEHRIKFTLDCADLTYIARELGIYLATNETGRTEYQQAEYVRTGKSWSMSSDHREKRSVDWVYYIIPSDTGKPVPIWSPSINENLHKVLVEWVRIDEDYNYCGWFEWDEDSPHMGRNRKIGQNLKSRIAAGLENG